MKMQFHLRSLAAVMAIGTSTALADVTLDFNYGGGSVLNGLQPLTLNFNIDGAGIVSLNASTANTNAAFVTAVDAWDAANVGSVSEAALFGTSFTLTGVTSGPGLVLGNTDTGVLGISGQAAARIDQNGAEALTFNLTGLASGYGVQLVTVSWGNRAANGASGIKLLDTDTTLDFLIPNTATFANTNLSGAGFLIGTGEGLVFTTKDNSATAGTIGAGYGLAGFSFGVIAVPEPTSLALIGLGSAAILLLRRRSR